MADVIAGLAFGALPVAILLYQSAVKIYDTVTSVQGFGSDLGEVAANFRIEKQKFSNWGKGCDLARHGRNDPGQDNEGYEVLLESLTRMCCYLDIAQTSINRYMSPPGKNVNPPDPSAVDIRRLVPHMLGAALDDLSPEIQEALGKLQRFATNVNAEQPTAKILSKGLREVGELEKLIDKIRRLNADLRALRSPAEKTTRVTDEFRVPIKHLFQKNRNFFGRAEILKEIKEIFGTTSSNPSLHSTNREIITLHGIGGAGKSQICVEYAHACGGAYSTIFWITATTADDVRRTALGAVDQIISHYTTNLPNHGLAGPSNFQRAALALGFDESSIEDLEELRTAVEKRSALEVLKHWLSKEFNNRWLLIIDDYSIPRDSDYNLDGILPTNDVGHVIVTTQKPGPTDQNPIRIPESIGEEKGVLLLKALGCRHRQKQDCSCGEDAREIVSILGGFPLALRLAGAYAFRYSFEQCAQELRDSRGSRFIFEDKDDLKKNSLGNIWELSFSKLDRNAQKMLHLLSFMGNDIPVALVNRAKDEIMRYCEAGERKAIDDAVADLRLLSFITEKPGKRYEIHDLVNRWAQAQLEDADLQVIAEHAASIVTSTLILDGDARAPSEWVYERKIMSQIDHCYDIFQTRLAPKDMNDQTRSIACKLAKVYEYHSNAEKPEVLYRRSLRDVKKGSEAIEELRIMNYLGVNLTFRADLRKDDPGANSLGWYERAYKGMKNLGLGDNTVDVMETKKHMADFFRRNGKPFEAIGRYKEVLGVQETEFGKDDPRTLETRCCLGDALMAHGQIDEALHQFERVKSVREVVLEKDHTKTLEVVYLIAEIHDRKGEHKKAIEMCEGVLRVQAESLGENHYSTIETIYRIGDIHRRMHQYHEALRYFKMALEGLEKIFGVDNSHHLTLMVQGGFADVSDLEGHYHKALEVYRKLHDVYKRSGAGGKASIWELRTALDIGRVLDKMGHYETAFKFLKETEQTMKKREDDGELKNHFLTPSSVLRVGNVHESQGKYGEALESYTWVKKRCSEARGEGHTTTLVAVCSIARVLNKQGKYTDALAQYKISEAGQRKAVGASHSATLKAILGQAEVYQNMGQPKQSSPLYQKVMDELNELDKDRDDRCAQDVAAEVRRKDYRHPIMLMAIYGMGRAFESDGVYDKALQSYDDARKGWESSLGEGHTLTLMAKLGSGRILQKQKNYQKAREIYDRIWLDMTRNDHPLREEQPLRMEHPLRYETACCKGSVLFKLGQYEDAKASYDEALGGLGRILGDDHPTTLGAIHGKADVLEKERNYRDALELYQRAAAGLSSKLGNQHPETLQCQKKVSSVQKRMKWGRWSCFSCGG